MFSVLILTLNEQRNLPRCLASLRSCDDVVVLDSGSQDQTVELARAAGARVFTRAFDDFATQRNFAQREIPFRHPWVFHLDADEQMTPELMCECAAHARREDIDGFWVAPKMLFHGRWIRRCTDFPAYQARFVRAPQFSFVQVGHGQREAPTMRMARVSQNYLHDLTADGEESWIEKHRRYAHEEATRHRDERVRCDWPGLLARDPLRRRRALKQLSFSLPFRPTLRFCYQYVIRRGFLDGSAGLRYCRLLARYEAFVAEELRQIRPRRRP